MSLGRALAVGLVGLDGRIVEVEAQLAAGLPAFRIVGLPDASLAEARERVRAALESSGLNLPNRRITVNLSPAAMPKSGSAFDLALAIAVVATGAVPERDLAARTVHVGELGLDGRLHPVRGVLPMVAAAVASGFPRVVVPAANAEEASLIPGARVTAAEHLADVLALYGIRAESVASPVVRVGPDDPDAERPAPLDLADVLGQDHARMALEVAAAGGHHMYLVGPPGAGKTMLASRLPTILPELSDDDAVTVTSIHSLAGTFRPEGGLMRRVPFEAPHHTASRAAIVGGGSGTPRPGSISRAHRGVLFLDEAPEFPSAVLQTLRQPLESGAITIHRAAAAASYPARFQLIMAANPCPCGLAGSSCQCTPIQRRRYASKLSGPLLDRVDIQIEVPRVTRAMAAVGERGETSDVVAQRVADARSRQEMRFADLPWSLNSAAPGSWLRGPGRVASGAALRGVERLVDTGRLSMRGFDRVLRLAWTLADLGGAPAPTDAHLAGAITLRTGEQYG